MNNLSQEKLTSHERINGKFGNYSNQVVSITVDGHEFPALFYVDDSSLATVGKKAQEMKHDALVEARVVRDSRMIMGSQEKRPWIVELVEK